MRLQAEGAAGELIFTDGPARALGRALWIGPGVVVLIGASGGAIWLAQHLPEPLWATLFGVVWLILAGIVGIGLIAKGRQPFKRLSLAPAHGMAELLTRPMGRGATRCRCPLADLPPPRVYLLPSAPDTSETAVLEISLGAGEYIAIADFGDEAAAQAMAARVRAMITAARQAG
ncbi:hypothetical protein [Paenirhodobacter sp. CAU 1674]|uniref:hypothetical protein n=1 Tax=Paenirhodobacter sp. CAU 1674 TaxID=3032596 RepID=UPI0023DA22AD|nr:hypothetical protein [Paenirhodobacter sp. CAU 1674]MDF2142169.1 hypothetical protein [Paenirhodobacter sp. CAU 1674]